MLTVKEINEVSFGKAGFSGYKPEDVDSFIDEVVESFQQLIAERDEARKQAEEFAAQNADLSAKNAEIQKKLAILAQKIESYREEEDGIKDALLSAQKLARDSVQEAKDKAEIILQDAQNGARQMMDNAKIEASKAAKEYMTQAETKKNELEEIKRQVSAFRVSLLEMYKKHLECINHIPTFRQKETAPAEQPAQEQAAYEAPQAEPVEEPLPEEPVLEEPVPLAEVYPAPVQEEPAVEEPPVPVAVPQARRRQERRTEPQERPTLHDKVDYSQEQLQASEPLVDDDYLDDDLSEVGIDLKTYNNIPETLKREKSSHFSNLEFGENVELDGNHKKRKK